LLASAVCRGGSFFPAWLVCFIVAIVLTALVRLLVMRLYVTVALPMLVYPGLAAFAQPRLKYNPLEDDILRGYFYFQIHPHMPLHNRTVFLFPRWPLVVFGWLFLRFHSFRASSS
jgi:hypothetical protein